MNTNDEKFVGYVDKFSRLLNGHLTPVEDVKRLDLFIFVHEI